MNLIKIALCILFAMVLLAGCTPRSMVDVDPTPAEEVVETAELLPEEIDEVIIEQIEESFEAEAPAEEQSETANANAAALTALFDGVRESVFPGTAGSSLTAAAHAAEMADFFAASGVSPDEVDRAARNYIASLSGDDVQLYEMQLDAVVGAFSNLTAENGAGLLEDCGYESSYYPWSEENVKDCFVALLGTD